MTTDNSNLVFVKMEKFMKKYRVLSLLLSLLILLSLLPCAVFADPEETTAPQETEPAWADDPTGYRENLLAGAPEYEAGCDTALLLELNSGIVVYGKNAEATVYPASLTKIMTCMLALQYAGKDMDKLVTVSETALEGIAEAGGEIVLKVGERLTLRDLLYYLMISSNNEAGNVIAEYVAGDIPSFVSLMNKTARELGCTGTNFANSHGLHDPNHYTTARDLSIITRKALTYEDFREICNTVEYTVPATNLSKANKLVTTNNLILNNGNRYYADDGNYYTYYYEDATGIKTGYTSAAGRCVISRATDGNMDLMCIILGAQTRMMSDGSVRYDNFVEAKKLFNYGFNNFAYAKVIVSKIDPIDQVPVEYATEKRGVVLIASSDVNCLLPKDYDKNKVTTDYTLYDSKGLTAPLEQGQKVGTLYVYYNGTLVGQTELETLTAVEEKSVEKAIADITGKDTPDSEKTVFQKILKYAMILFLIIVGLFVLLILYNIIYRVVRRHSIRRRRERDRARIANRDARRREAEREPMQQRAPSRTTRRSLERQQGRRVPQDRDPGSRGRRP